MPMSDHGVSFTVDWENDVVSCSCTICGRHEKASLSDMRVVLSQYTQKQLERAVARHYGRCMANHALTPDLTVTDDKEGR